MRRQEEEDNKSSSSIMSTAVNEEALKKNTDCVYFLASPLTCKKGNDCEFRHSESARINPRDCWFWLSGACLNASCPFRHPPLEGIPENDPATAAAIGGKPRVPCYYFSQGYCAKGDKCIFMHGLVLPSTTEVSQKLLKPNAIKAMELNDNQVSANKGNGSVTSKPSFDSYETPLDVLPPVSAKSNQALEEADAKFIDIISRMSEGSDSSVPARPRMYQGAGLNDRSKQVSAINDRLRQVQTSDNNFLHLQQTQAEDDTLCDAQPGDESPRQAHSGEDRIQNGTESEELWEESSFDVLVDDGTDQLIYAEDIDYLSPCDIIVDPLRGHIQAGMMGAEGFADYEYEHAGVYDQYYDASAEYELATYDAYEQQLVYDQLNSYDYNNGIQPAIAFKGRPVKEMLPPDRRGVPFDGEARGAAVSSNDLRNHIVKRRRAERNQKHGEDYPRRRQQGNGFHHSRRNQDGHLKLQEVLARNRILPQPGTRSNRQFQGRGEQPAGNRQFHGRLVEPMGTKRVYRDMALDQEETSTERVSGKKSRNMDEHFKAKFKKERGWPVAAGTGEVVGVRVHAALHSQKAEVRKDDSSFAGPKSLAQIKAEKMKASGEGSSGQQQDSPGEVSNSLNHVVKCQAPHMSKISPVQGSVNNELASKEPSKIMTPGVSKDSDFEGPKPLSVILKQKHKEDGNGKLKEHRQERSFLLEGDMAVDSMMASGLRTSFSLPAGAKDPKDGELLQAANPGKSETKSVEAVEHGSNHRDNGFQQQGAANMITLLSNNNREEPEDTQANKLVKEVDPVFDTEDGVDAGDSVMDDVEFEDDDEDDFAKKLGGFFS